MFKQLKIYLTLAIILIVAVNIYLLRNVNFSISQSPHYLKFSQNPDAKEKNENMELPVIILQDMFYEKINFANALVFAQNTAVKNNIFSIIVPHHLLASQYIANLIKMSNGREIKNVVIIGPNHENIGADFIAATKAKWQTPFGYLETNNELVDYFLSDFDLTSDQYVFAREHSIGAIVPFVKYYFPQAKIVPIVFSSYAGLREAERVNEWLVENLPEKSLIIISIDFSHYLTKEEADHNDKIIKQLINNRDIEKIIKLNNDYVDSPVSLAAALLFANKKELKTSIIHNSNSFDFSVIKPTETTSYFGIAFTED